MKKLFFTIYNFFRPERKKIKRSYGTITTFPALEAFRDYLEGTKTLKEFQEIKEVSKTEPINTIDD